MHTYHACITPCITPCLQWYKYVEVGHSLKSPDLPVWVVCSESHFTVLFAQVRLAVRCCLH